MTPNAAAYAGASSGALQTNLLIQDNTAFQIRKNKMHLCNGDREAL
jgi:hypothetical protein